VNRREFLELGYLGALAAGLPRATFAAEAKLTGHIVAVSTLSSSDALIELSDIVDLDLATGEVRYTSLPDYRFGHSLVPMPNGDLFAVPYGDDKTPCLFLDKKFSVLGEVNAPEGYGFAGHAVISPDGNSVVAHFNRADYGGDEGSAGTGDLCVIDIAGKRVSKTLPTNILHGHDIILSRDKRHIIVGDDGTLESRSSEDMSSPESTSPFMLITSTPSLTLFDAKSFEHQKTIPLPINGSFVHIEEDADGAVFGAVEQFVANNPSGLSELRGLLGDDVERYVDSLQLDELDDLLPYPGPLMRVNVETGEIESHQMPQNQAPFDIKRNVLTGRVVNVFTDSNMLARYNPLSGRWGYFSTVVYGIKQPFGVMDIPGTPYMAVNGFLEGIAIFDVVSMSLVRKFETHNFGIKHMLYQS
jgi:hypothetical protein